MHVLALGGAGRVGRHALAAYAAFAEIDRITVADIDGEAAADAAAAVAAQALTLDVLDAATLTQALARADVVVNTCGPYFRYGLYLLKETIAAGKPYLDVCDDPEATLGMLVQDIPADRAGVTAAIGLGLSPGVTNLLALRAHAALDSVQHLYTLRDARGELCPAAPNAAHLHWLQQYSGRISVYRHGARVVAQALEPVKLKLPGYGKTALFRAGQPEAVTLARHFQDLEEAPSLIALDPESVDRLHRLGERIGQEDVELDDLAERLAQCEPADVNLRSRLLPLIQRSIARKAKLPPLAALAVGTRQGLPAQALATLVDDNLPEPAATAGRALAAGLRLWLDGELNGPGVHCPETAVDGKRFFAALAAIGGAPASEDWARIRVE